RRGHGDERRRNRRDRRRRRHLLESAAPVHKETARIDAAGMAAQGSSMRRASRPWRAALALPAFCLALAGADALAAHGYGQFGELRNPAGFANFEWVNPKAPKGGDIVLVPPLRITNFDKYNPFILKGTAPPG